MCDVVCRFFWWLKLRVFVECESILRRAPVGHLCYPIICMHLFAEDACIYVYISKYLYLSIYIHVYMYMYVYIYTYVCVWGRVRVCVRVRVCGRVCVRVLTSIC